MARKPKEPSGKNVVDLDAKRSERLTDELVALVQRTASLLDEEVRLSALASRNDGPLHDEQFDHC
jgi:hypothetical protein